MPKITLEEFFSGGMKVIECTTKEQSDAVREAFHDFGKKWNSGDSYIYLDLWENGYTYMHYTNDGRKGCKKPDPSWEVYGFDDIEFSPNYEPDPNQLRVLLRNDYKWHNACWDGQSKLLSVGKNRLNTTDIISIENDPRTKYVQCSMCNSIIRNTKKAIADHTQLGSSSKACLQCKYVRFDDTTTLKESIVKNEDGTYTKVNKTVGTLKCGNAWGKPAIDSNDARKCCIYRRCSADTIAPVDDFFSKYPGAFDDMATIDAIDMNKWDVYCKHYNDYIELSWKGRYHISIYTTNLGIIDVMQCYYRNKSYRIVYSKKYDKMFALAYGEYAELTATNSDFSTQYYNELLKIMRNIYKGEN